MIYILTPFMEDFRRVCIANDCPFRNGNNHPDVVWVNSVLKLYGRRITKDDVIIKGELYHEFSPEEAHRHTSLVRGVVD